MKEFRPSSGFIGFTGIPLCLVFISFFCFFLGGNPLFSKDDGRVNISVAIDGRKQETRAMALIKAGPNVVWRVLTDFDRHEAFMPNVTESRIVSSAGNSLIVYKELRVALQKISFTLAVTLNENRLRYSWVQHEGPFKINSGSWELIPVKGITELHYTTVVEPNFYLPAWIKKLLVKRSVPRLFRAIEKEAIALQGAGNGP